jgi:hypothetical protein
MKRKRFSEGKIIGGLKEHEAGAKADGNGSVLTGCMRLRSPAR